ncbi:MAG: hypothetical protein KDH15_09180 [Rhodocyclaceae bacterium]|nr:hypothetical protein [Rhodocyclaceae bacterium]
MNVNEPGLILTIFYGGLGLYGLGLAIYALRAIGRAWRKRTEERPVPLRVDVTSATITIAPGTQFSNISSMNPAARHLAQRA